MESMEGSQSRKKHKVKAIAQHLWSPAPPRRLALLPPHTLGFWDPHLPPCNLPASLLLLPLPPLLWLLFCPACLPPRHAAAFSAFL